MIPNINEIRNLNNIPPPNGPPRPSGSPKEAESTGAPKDRVTISSQARKAAANETAGITSERDLSDEEKRIVNELKKRDAEVKAHERSHMAAGAGIVQGGASFQFQKGPDGRMYAVGGEVKIDVSPEGSPEATIRKMQQVKAAALAPAEPSGTDRAVAAQAAQMEAQARIELREEASENEGRPAGALSAGRPEGPADAMKPSEQKAVVSSNSAQGDPSSEPVRRIDLMI